MLRAPASRCFLATKYVTWLAWLLPLLDRAETGGEPDSEEWYHFDDTVVAPCTASSVYKSQAYLLFYMQL